MFRDGQRLVEHGILMRLDVEPSAMQLVGVMTNADVMPDANRGIVHEDPPLFSHRQTERELPMHLRTSAAEPLVEPDVAERRQAERTTDPLEDVHVARGADAGVVIADRPPEPLHAANVSRARIRTLLNVATAQSDDWRINLESCE